MARDDSEWERLERTGAFTELIKSKKAFIIPATIFFMVFYFTLPFLTAFTTVLNFSVVGAITGAYVYAFAQFIMTWGLAHLYLNRANKWDDLVDEARRQAAREEAGEGGGA